MSSQSPGAGIARGSSSADAAQAVAQFVTFGTAAGSSIASTAGQAGFCAPVFSAPGGAIVPPFFHLSPE